MSAKVLASVTHKPYFKQGDFVLYHNDLFNIIAQLADNSVDMIFADPPYNFDDNQFSKIPELVFQNDLLLDGGILIVEHSKHTNLSNIENYAYSKNYGGNVFSFFEKT